MAGYLQGPPPPVNDTAYRQPQALLSDPTKAMTSCLWLTIGWPADYDRPTTSYWQASYDWLAKELEPTTF